ncbi:MAG: hypothetical protein KBS70_01065 [Bacteroidales bacterium]|nr:hypothetical protein [Candidatus Colicola equi]
MPKRLKIEDVIDRMYLLMEQKEDETLIEDTYHELCEEFNLIANMSDDAYTIFVQFKAMACVVRANIYANNADAIEEELSMLSAMEGVQAMRILTDSQFLKIYELVHEVVDDCNEFCKKNGFDPWGADMVKDFGKINNSYDEIEHKPEAEHDCYLCRVREGNFPGSHLAPNFLIQPFLTEEHTVKRNKEIYTEIVLGENKKARKWGREVLPETVADQFGEVTDEELTRIKTSALTRDNYFCHKCEDRFGLYETVYSEYHTGKKMSIDPKHSYIFWLGVFWRLSIANMCVKMSPEDEDQIRQILDAVMPYEKKNMQQPVSAESMGDYCYTIVHCANTKSERFALLGRHTGEPPYVLVIGSYIITLYRNREEAKDVLYSLNDYTKAEETVEVDFWDYWRMKQMVMNEIQFEEMSNMHDGGSHMTDIAFGGDNDNLARVFMPAGGDVNKMPERGEGKYGFVIPGALMKLLAYSREHAFDDVDEMWKGFEKEYGYTKEEIEVIANDVLDGGNIRRIMSDADRERHKRRQQASKAKQHRNKRRRKH